VLDTIGLSRPGFSTDLADYASIDKLFGNLRTESRPDGPHATL